MTNPENMKTDSSTISGMNDSQIQEYLSQMGLSGVNPSKFRIMCQNMTNMSDSKFNSKKNISQNNIQNTNYSYKSDNHFNNKNGIIQHITNMKEEGNNLFRNGKYEEAIKKYYETIQEIAANDEEKYKTELDNIERICRLNIANCKLKTGDYEGVINECSIVLESKKCFKGYYRMGLALMKKNKYDQAFRYFENAYSIGTASEKKCIEPYLKECKERFEEIKKKQRVERLQKENEENEEQKNNSDPEKREKKENKIKFNPLRKIFMKEKIRNKNNKEKEKEKGEEDDIKFEDGANVKNSNNNKKYNINIYPASCNCSQSNNNSNNINNIDNQNQNLNQSKEQINNMSDEQLNLLVNQMKNMDNRTLKKLMAAQGIALSDQQIEMMKISMTPETLKKMKNPNFQPPNMNNIKFNKSNNQNTKMPNLANMDIQQMMEFMKKNPELFKILSPQLSNVMEGGDTDPGIMMESIENIFWIFNFLEQIINFLFSWRGVCFIILIIAIIYAIIKKINQ